MSFFTKILKSLGKELHTFKSSSIDSITNENVDIKVIKYEYGQICFYYRNSEIPSIEVVIVSTPITYTRAFQIRYIYYPKNKKISNLSILDPEGSLPIILNG